MIPEHHQILLEEQIRASNRTTAALRALAIFFVYESAYALAAFLLIAIGIAPTFALDEPIYFLIFVGVIVGLAGLVHSIASALRELRESVIQGFNYPRLTTSTSRASGKDAVETKTEKETADPSSSDGEKADYKTIYGLD